MRTPGVQIRSLGPRIRRPESSLLAASMAGLPKLAFMTGRETGPGGMRDSRSGERCGRSRPPGGGFSHRRAIPVTSSLAHRQPQPPWLVAAALPPQPAAAALPPLRPTLAITGTNQERPVEGRSGLPTRETGHPPRGSELPCRGRSREEHHQRWGEGVRLVG